MHCITRYIHELPDFRKSPIHFFGNVMEPVTRPLTRSARVVREHICPVFISTFSSAFLQSPNSFPLHPNFRSAALLPFSAAYLITFSLNSAVGYINFFWVVYFYSVVIVNAIFCCGSLSCNIFSISGIKQHNIGLVAHIVLSRGEKKTYICRTRVYVACPAKP